MMFKVKSVELRFYTVIVTELLRVMSIGRPLQNETRQHFQIFSINLQPSKLNDMLS